MTNKKRSKWWTLAIIAVAFVLDINPVTLLVGIPVTLGAVYLVLKGRWL